MLTKVANTMDRIADDFRDKYPGCDYTFIAKWLEEQAGLELTKGSPDELHEVKGLATRDRADHFAPQKSYVPGLWHRLFEMRHHMCHHNVSYTDWSWRCITHKLHVGRLTKRDAFLFDKNWDLSLDRTPGGA